MIIKQHLTTILIGTGGILIGVFGGMWLTFENVPCKESFVYLNQNVICNEAFVIKKHGYAEIKDKLLDLFETYKNEGKTHIISVYFRDLVNGPTLGINEHELYSPASLLKVPVLLAYLQLAEEDPTILTRMLVYERVDEEERLIQVFEPNELIVPGQPYTIEDLLHRMIAYSDNDAYYVLYNFLGQLYPERNILLETHQDLGIIPPKGVGAQEIGLKAYASIFVQLFNATFFTTYDTSERALTLLSHTEFKDGLVAGVPDEIVVAHKFGERFVEDLKQLHDCGIVYYPDNPYLLCVMTQGDDFQELKEIIKTISKMIYEEVDSRRIEK